MELHIHEVWKITVPDVDPSHKLIDRDREDNVVEVKAAAAGEAL